jgi:flagellar hook-associated protein 1 FlgK
MAIVNFSAGLSALRVNQQVLDLLGHNIANINTPGYHRQEPLLAARFVPENPIGFGVELTTIRRLRDGVLEQAIRQNAGELAFVSSRLSRLREVETILGSGSGSLRQALDEFFNRLEELAVRPADLTQRRLVLDAADRLANRFHQVADQLNELREGITAEVQTALQQANALTKQIAELNGRIAQALARGSPANDAQDRRDQLIQELAQLVGVQVIEQPLGQVNVLVGGNLVVSGSEAVELRQVIDSENRLLIFAGTSAEPVTLPGGRLAGLLQTRNETLADFRQRLDELARVLMREFDAIHARGLGLAGPFTFLAGTRSVSHVDIFLDRADTAWPIRNGTVYVSITNLATGQRTLHAVSVQPSAQTLAQLASAFSSVPHFQAIADPQTRTLKFLAEPGYAFDFAGRLPTQPATSITGTAQPSVSGTYTGTVNDTYTFKALTSGTIGVTPNLTLEIRNSAGQVLGTVQVGQGYAPGTAIPAVDGLLVQLSAGTLNAGDSFQVPVIAEPDTAGLLSALGLNTLFTGKDAATVAVQPDVLANPARLAISRTGAPAEAGRLREMLALRSQVVFPGSGLTLAGFYDRMVADIGAQVQSAAEVEDHLHAVGQQLQAEQQAVSGVDPNEELVRLLQHQRAFQLAARYISVVNDTLDELLRIV